MSRVSNNAYVPANDAMAPVALPNTIKFQAQPSAMAGNVHQKYVSSSSSTVLTSGQTIRLEIPNKGLLLPGAFLHFKLATRNNAGTGRVTLPHSSVVVRRLDVRVGSTTLDSISAYGTLYSILKTGNMSNEYVVTDGSILEFCGEQLPVNGTAPAYNADTSMVMPFLSGILSHRKAIPLEIFSSPLVINIELAPAADIDGSAGFEYRITDPRVYYRILEQPPAYYAQLRQELAQAGVMRLEYLTFSSHEFGIPAGGTFSQNIGENCSSLLGILAARRENTDRMEVFKLNGWSDVDVRVDGMSEPSYRIDDAILSFGQIQELFGHLFDTQTTGCIDRAQYLDNRFFYGINTTKFHDGSLAQIGKAVMNTINILQNGNTNACTCYVFTVKQYSLLVSPDGMVQVSK